MDKSHLTKTLPTKLRPPECHFSPLVRARIIDAVADLGQIKLVSLAAPAGAGKTTALSQWYQALRDADVSVVWLSLDAFDNEPARFFCEIILALQNVRPGIGREILHVLTSTPDPSIKEAVASLCVDLLDTDQQIALFLDDYHAIDNPRIHGALAFLIRYLPTNITLIIAGREVAPLPTARLRVAGELLDLRWNDLQFTLPEAQAYLRAAQGLDLTEGQILTLYTRTEGWIAGLQLAALLIRSTGDADRFIHEFSGAEAYVADYLLEDVVQQQPRAVREFLLRTAILDRLSGPLCDAVTGRNDGQKLLERLEQANLFVFRLDNQRNWYRYHHLFSEFLQQRLHAEHPDLVPELNARASAWYEINGPLTEAVRYSIGGQRFEDAAIMLIAAGRELFRQGELRELRRWIEQLPASIVHSRPELCVLNAWALAFMGRLRDARWMVSLAEGTLRTQGRAATSDSTSLSAELRVLRAALGVIEKNEPDLAGLPQDLPSAFPDKELAMRAFAHVILGHVCRVDGRLATSAGHFTQALTLAERANSAFVSLIARYNRGSISALMGHLKVAEASLRNSLEMATARGWARTMGAAFLRVQLGVVLRERNELEEALADLNDAVAILEMSEALGFLGVALVERSATYGALGQTSPSREDLIRARELAAKEGLSRVLFRSKLIEASLYLDSSNLTAAAEILNGVGEEFAAVESQELIVLPERYEAYLLIYLRLLVARSELSEALRLAVKAASSARAAGRGSNRVAFLVLQSIVWWRLGISDRVDETLTHAVGLAAEDRLVRAFAPLPSEMIANLRKINVASATAGIMTEIERAITGNPAPSSPASAGLASGTAPLPQRELQILKLMATGLRNREIGERLFISEETVKWYLKRLYGKLQVHTRTQAVAAARKLRLVR